MCSLSVLWVCEHTHIFLQKDHCLTWKINHVDIIIAKLFVEQESEVWVFPVP